MATKTKAKTKSIERWGKTYTLPLTGAALREIHAESVKRGVITAEKAEELTEFHQNPYNRIMGK